MPSLSCVGVRAPLTHFLCDSPTAPAWSCKRLFSLIECLSTLWHPCVIWPQTHVLCFWTLNSAHLGLDTHLHASISLPGLLLFFWQSLNSEHVSPISFLSKAVFVNLGTLQLPIKFGTNFSVSLKHILDTDRDFNGWATQQEERVYLSNAPPEWRITLNELRLSFNNGFQGENFILLCYSPFHILSD